MRLLLNGIVCAGILFLICSGFIFSAEIDDTVMEHYLNKADSVLNSSTLFNNNLEFSVALTSIYNIINYRGIALQSDTAKYLVDCIDAQFSISETIDSASVEENIIPSNILFEKPWVYNCRFYFFPRDIGAGDLAIGFAPADSLEKRAPEGMIIIDRSTYIIKHIYLHYLNIDDYEWLSKDYQFSFENEKLLLKSLTLQGCYYGFFQRRYFKQELIFKNYNIH